MIKEALSGGDCLVDPSGEIVPLYGGGHIQTVLAKPELFGLTLADIQAVYDKYGEHLGIEGKARDEILVDTFKQGWMRVNYYDRNDKFIINAWTYDDATIWRLKQFARKASGGVLGKKYGDYSEVKVTFFGDGNTRNAALGDLKQGIIAKVLKVKKLSLRRGLNG